MHYLGAMPVAEVAESLGVSQGTVKARLSRGRAALAELLADPPESFDALRRPGPRPAPRPAPPRPRETARTAGTVGQTTIDIVGVDRG